MTGVLELARKKNKGKSDRVAYTIRIGGPLENSHSIIQKIYSEFFKNKCSLLRVIDLPGVNVPEGFQQIVEDGTGLAFGDLR